MTLVVPPGGVEGLWGGGSLRRPAEMGRLFWGGLRTVPCSRRDEGDSPEHVCTPVTLWRGSWVVHLVRSAIGVVSSRGLTAFVLRAAGGRPWVSRRRMSRAADWGGGGLGAFQGAGSIGKGVARCLCVLAVSQLHR
jgi:hypothetical protein